MTSEKPTNTIVLDTGPIIKGNPSISSLLAQSEQLVTLPAVIQEIRDEATRSRLQTTLLPFLALKTPKESSIKVISDFARRTGDLSVLSRVDIQLLALTYDLECERNGGDWRLRKAPGEKRIIGPKPGANAPRPDALDVAADRPEVLSAEASDAPVPVSVKDQIPGSCALHNPNESIQGSVFCEVTALPDRELEPLQQELQLDEPAADDKFNEMNAEEKGVATLMDSLQLADSSNEDESGGSDSEGWITPSNLKKKQEEDGNGNTSTAPEPKTLQVALLTSDYAMQNVALQMNLNLLSPALHRVRHIKTFVLRCHACFNVVKDTSKQFCPRCGKPTLTRVSCSTDQNGQFKMHLKKNMQWNKRGDRFSVPKPVAGAANGRVKGGGKGGWGNDLILAEDQKEYVKAITEQKREKQRDFMDEDYLPGILSGSRSNSGGRIKVGAGRNVNSKKRR